MSKKTSKETDRQLRKLSISPNGEVKVTFIEVLLTGSIEERVTDELTESENASVVNEFTVKSPLRPHKDLLDAMKKLRGHGMDICEMFLDSKARAHYDISSIKIVGDVLMKQSRVIMTISKEVKRTGKYIHWDTPQTTMYGESEYPKAEEMSRLIENVIEETWLYLDGKGELDNQLPLFPKIELQTA